MNEAQNNKRGYMRPQKKGNIIGSGAMDPDGVLSHYHSLSANLLSLCPIRENRNLNRNTALVPPA